MDQLKILLLQARHPDDPERAGEHACFVRATGLDAEQIVPHDLLAGPPSLARIRQHDALMVGGSGEFYVSRGDLPHLERLLETLAEVAEVGHPTFASCFGYQLLVQALGGEIVHDPESMEVGTYDLELSPAGREDELFGHLPSSFKAQLGRKDRAASLPPAAVNLARSAANPHQALRLPGRPVWASQFHPELDRDSNRGRFMRYLDDYAALMSPEELEEALARYGTSPEASQLLRRFLKLNFG